MTTPGEQTRARIQAVADLLGEREGWHLTSSNYHVLQRLATLVGDEEVLHANSSLALGADFPTSGSMLAITAHRVVLVRVSGAPPPEVDLTSPSAVSASTWARSALVQVAIEQAENGDGIWQQVW